MAIDPSSEYGVQVDTSTDPSGYPYGQARDITVTGDGTGTPLRKEWLSDLWGFLQALLVDSGQAPSGTPDKVGASQYLEAVRYVIEQQVGRSMQVANWFAQSPADAGDGYHDAAFGNGLLVAVGSNSGGDKAIFSSTDGINWSAVSGGALSGHFGGVCYSGSLWCVVGDDGEIKTSPDGVTWTARTAAGGYSGEFESVTFGGGLFVAVGTAGAIQTSPDGITWTARTAAASFAGTFRSVTYADGIFVAVGASGTIQTSPDGITWTARTAAGAYAGILWSVSGNGTIFVAVGASNEIQTSPDGVTWTQRTSAGSGNLLGVEWNGYLFVVVGSGGGLQTSSDGVTWKKQVIAPSAASFVAAAWTGSFWAIVANTDQIQTSLRL